MRTLLHRYRRHIDRASQGQALAEFALIAVVLLLIFGTALDLGRVFYADITIENAARAGALQAVADAQTPSPTAGCDYATNKIGCATINESRGSFVIIDGNDIDSRCENDGRHRRRVPDRSRSRRPARASRSRRTFDLLTPILSVFFGGQTIDMSATVASDQEALPSPLWSPSLPSRPRRRATAHPTEHRRPDPSGSPDPSSSPDPSTTPVPTETPNINCDPEDTVAPNLVVGCRGRSRDGRPGTR